MSTVVLDTDVFSYMLKRDTRAEHYESLVDGATLSLSFMSVAELYRWAISHRWGVARRRSLELAIGRCVVLPYDKELAQLWAAMTVQRARAGRPIACSDCWIAASAVRHGLPLVTNNHRDFSGLDGLQVLY